MKSNNFQKEWPKIVAKAWSDENFKNRLISKPEAVLKEYGLTLPKGVKCEIEENTNKLVHLALPMRPEGSLSEQEMLKIAAAGTMPCYGAAV